MKQHANVTPKLFVTAAIDAAKERGARSVESEHLLLAIAERADPPLRAALADLGLDPGSLDRLLREERARSLSAAGVQPLPTWALGSVPRIDRPHWGASTRSALVRAGRIARQSGRRRMEGADIVLAIAAAEFGTVPRVLALAEVTRDSIELRLRAA